MPDVLHYPGNQTAFDPDWILGPDSDRRYVRVTSADYDPLAKITTCVLRAILPAEFRERVGRIQRSMQDRERILKLFNG